MYVTVFRLISRSGSIIDSEVSFDSDVGRAREMVIKSHHWTFENGEYVSTQIEWVENLQMMQK